MAQIFRVERTKNFTVMSNHHFKNKNLTLKAKGLLSLMLSLPEEWNYNMQGLATLSRDGIDSVRSAIKELEHHGYVERHRLRNEYGFYGDTEYIIREVPLGVENCVLWHKYTVSFLAYRIWEEISMYNHITNNWDKEHLIPIDPVYAETQV